jgi:tRNA A-37 threonylcarbamoyl transferase component Bud32
MSQFKDQEKEALAPPSLKVSPQAAPPFVADGADANSCPANAEQNANRATANGDSKDKSSSPPPWNFVPPTRDDNNRGDEHWYDKRERLRQESLEQYRAQYGDEAYHAAVKNYKSPYDEALEASNRSWEGINQFLDITAHLAGFALTAGIIIVGLIVFATLNAHSAGPPPEIDWSNVWLFQFFKVLSEGHAFKGVNNMEQVLNLLPFAAFGCALTTAFATYIARSAKSREIDWTDSHLMLEYSGPINLAFKWTAIKSVDQIWRWDIFHGRQPVFLLSTNEGNVFKLKLSDIAAKNNIGSFFSLIKEHAPKAKFNVDPKFATDESYTELWLKYFSKATDRTRSGLLETDMLVADGMYRIVGTVGGGGQGTAYLAIVEKNQIPESAYGSTGLDGKVEVSMGNKEARHIVKVDQGASEPRKKLVIGQEVVLKEYILPVHRGQLTAERTAEKLKAEAEILDKLDHEHIVKLKDAFIEDYRGYLVLDFVSGESLKSLTDRLGPQTEEQIVDWAIQALDILQYMHELTPSLVHRDITPDNLMLQEDGFIKLVDFNVAYQVDSSATATVVGKHAYIPAEQFRGKPTPQSDIYSLGGTMFYLLTGKEPEPISTSYPANHSQFVSPELDAIVAKATSTPLDQRYKDVQEFKDELLKLKKS